RGIAHLVSSSVKGLNVSDVTITDDQGNLLWPTDDQGLGTSPTTKLEAQQRYDSQLSTQLNALLASTLGAGKAQVRVHSDLNVDQGTVDKVTYAKTGTPLQTSVDNETLRSQGTTQNTA